MTCVLVVGGGGGCTELKTTNKYQTAKGLTLGLNCGPHTCHTGQLTDMLLSILSHLKQNKNKVSTILKSRSKGDIAFFKSLEQIGSKSEMFNVVSEIMVIGEVA